jgi:hypothetical protein
MADPIKPFSSIVGAIDTTIAQTRSWKSRRK